jgi:ABC-type nitrate/sulfonate/bicarbonate transport system permease component
MFTGIIAMALLGVVLYEFFDIVERRFDHRAQVKSRF